MFNNRKNELLKKVTNFEWYDNGIYFRLSRRSNFWVFTASSYSWFGYLGTNDWGGLSNAKRFSSYEDAYKHFKKIGKPIIGGLG
jgi:predicted small integral membrane protein